MKRRRTAVVTRARAAKIRKLQKRLKWLRSQYRKLQKLIRQGRSRSNPKRDGSPTRGEARMAKYQEHLRQVAKAGQAAHAQLLRLQGRGGSANESHPEPALKAPKTETQTAHPGHYAPTPSADESGEARNLRSRMSETQMLLDGFKKELEELGDSDENAAEAEVVQGEIIKLSQQMRKLKARAGELGVVMTNPGRRRHRRNPRQHSYYKRRRNSTRRNSYYR